jgi:hypothetical protein
MTKEETIRDAMRLVRERQSPITDEQAERAVQAALVKPSDPAAVVDALALPWSTTK